jgi:iron complex outermembrane receptor protein
MKKQSPLQVTSVGAAVAAILGTISFHSLPAMAADQGAKPVEELTEVTVTGSRITRRDFESSSPLVTVSSEQLQTTGTQAIETALNQLPQFVPSQTMFSSGDVQPSAFNNPGIVTLNLRGLGPNRNLVLIDGRRPQPANAQLVVDINSIPGAAIDSVEIITGGASATYGADAMGGVTNFKMKRNFQGLSVTAETTATQHGGGQESSLSALIGGNFGDGRGNAMVGLSFTDRKALMNADRSFFTNGWHDPGTPGTDALPFSQFSFPNIGFTPNAPDPAVWASIFGPGSYAGESVYLNADGSLFLNSAANPGIGYSGPINDQFKILNTGAVAANNLNSTLTTPLRRYSVFGNAHFDITDHTSAYLQTNISSMNVNTVLNYAPATSQWAASIPVDGRAIPAELQTLLDSRPNPTANYTLSRALDFAGPRSTQNNTDTYQVLVGLNGDIFGTAWKYDVYASHGRTSLLTEMTGFPGLQNYRAVVSAPNWGQNFLSTSGPPLFYTLQCTTGLPITSSFTPSSDCLNTISTNMKHLTEIKQDIVEANINGDLFQLPAGAVGSAWGATYRKDDYRWNPDSALTRPSTNYPVGLFATSPTQGFTTVKELYGELLVPVLKDLPGIKKLNLELGARWSDYNTAGKIWTYKALADWNVIDSVRFRGGYQQANRAPNVAELYTGVTTSVVFFQGGDPCMSNTTNTWGNTPLNTVNRQQVIDMCSQLINNSRGDVNQSPWHTLPNYPNNIVGPFPFLFQFELANITGNPKLKNEEGKTWTLGVVLTSPFDGIFSKATLAIDWYQIKLANAIAPTSAVSVYQKCLNADGSNPNYDFNAYCQLISRDADGYRAAVDTPYFNLGAIETSGVDVQFNWTLPLGPGRLAVNEQVNFLGYYRDQVDPTSPLVDRKNTFGTATSGAQYRYKTFTTLTYSQGVWSAGLRHRFLPRIKSAGYATDPNTTTQGAGAYSLIDAFGSYQINDKVQLRGGIDNLLDRDPAITGQSPTNTASGTTNSAYYDVLGRRFFLSVNLKL